MRPKSIDDLVDACTPEVRALLEAARARVRETVPHATEKLRPGWGLIGYDAPHYFAFIAPVRDHVRIGFEWGVLLSDPERVLEGEGSQVRYVSIRGPDDLASDALAAFLREAATIPPARRARKHVTPAA